MAKREINSKYLEYIPADEDQQKFNEILLRESDRGLILVAVSHIDGILKKLLQEYFLPPRNGDADMFKYGGALGSLSNRIDMSYSVGLFCANFAQVLDHMRKSRNEMAHYIDRFNLTDQPHIDHINGARDIIIKTDFFALIHEVYNKQTSKIRDVAAKSGMPIEDLEYMLRKERQDFMTIYLAVSHSLKFLLHCLRSGLPKEEVRISLENYMDDANRLSELLSDQAS